MRRESLFDMDTYSTYSPSYRYKYDPNIVDFHGGFLDYIAAKGIRLALDEPGADADGVIQGAEHALEMADDADGAHTPSDALEPLIAHCRTVIGHADFGLLAGAQARLRAFGLVGELMRHCPDAGSALKALEAHFHLQDRTAVMRLEKWGDLAALTYAPCRVATGGGARQSEVALAAFASILRELCGADWRPAEVLLPLAAPACSKSYQAFFGAPVWFDQEVASLVFDAKWLSHRLAEADPVARIVFDKLVLQLETQARPDLTEGLRRLLRTELTKRRCHATDIAQLMSVHRRTLNRRLKAEGMSFRQLTSEVRFDIACQLLRDTRMSLAQVSAVLDFSEPAAFTRAFRRWSGTSPSHWRRSCSGAASIVAAQGHRGEVRPPPARH